jgi:hypothetical protein
VASPYIMLVYVLWLLDDYAATALEGIVTPPAVLDSIGVWGYRQPFPALMPLLLHLLTTVAVAGLSRNQKAVQADAAASAAAAAAASAQQATERAEGAHGVSVGDAELAGPDEASTAVGVQHVDGSQAVAGGQLLGSSPIAAAGRELRQLVSFGGRMSYTEGELVTV